MARRECWRGLATVLLLFVTTHAVPTVLVTTDAINTNLVLGQSTPIHLPSPTAPV